MAELDRHERSRQPRPSSPLMGKLFDEAGQRLTPSQPRRTDGDIAITSRALWPPDRVEDVPGAWRLPAAQIETQWRR